MSGTLIPVLILSAFAAFGAWVAHRLRERRRGLKRIGDLSAFSDARREPLFGAGEFGSLAEGLGKSLVHDVEAVSIARDLVLTAVAIWRYL